MVTSRTVKRLRIKYGYNFEIPHEDYSKVLKNMQEEFEEKVIKYLGSG
jgi:hypothetical protein